MPITRCVYCGSTAFGAGCSNSPSKHHVHSVDGSICRYCGQAAYGSGCRYSPDGKHMHGISRPGEVGRCIWCGSPAYGSCGMSPSRHHEH